MHDPIASRDTRSHLNYTSNFARPCSSSESLSKELCLARAWSRELYKGFVLLNTWAGIEIHARVPLTMYQEEFRAEHVHRPLFAYIFPFSPSLKPLPLVFTFHFWSFFQTSSELLEAFLPSVHCCFFSSKPYFSPFPIIVISLIFLCNFLVISFHSSCRIIACGI